MLRVGVGFTFAAVDEAVGFPVDFTVVDFPGVPTTSGALALVDVFVVVVGGMLFTGGTTLVVVAVLVVVLAAVLVVAVGSVDFGFFVVVVVVFAVAVVFRVVVGGFVAAVTGLSESAPKCDTCIRENCLI